MEFDKMVVFFCNFFYVVKNTIVIFIGPVYNNLNVFKDFEIWYYLASERQLFMHVKKIILPDIVVKLFGIFNSF